LFRKKIKFLSSQPTTSPAKAKPNQKTNGKNKNPTFVFAPSKQLDKKEKEAECKNIIPMLVRMNYTHAASRHLEALAKAFKEKYLMEKRRQTTKKPVQPHFAETTRVSK